MNCGCITKGDPFAMNVGILEACVLHLAWAGGDILKERGRCAKIVEEAECYEHQAKRCEDCLMGIARTIREGK